MKKTRRRFKKKGRQQQAVPTAAAAKQVMEGVDLLKATQQRIEAGLTPQNRADYERVVVAGMKMALSGGVDSIIAGLKDSSDPVSDCATGAVNIVLYLRQQSRDTMPPQALVPAAMTLMLNALEFANRAGIIKVGRDDLVRGTRLFTNRIMQAFKVDSKRLAAMGQAVDRIASDPAQMDLLARRAGIVRDPRASIPVTPPGQPRGLINEG